MQLLKDRQVGLSKAGPGRGGIGVEYVVHAVDTDEFLDPIRNDEDIPLIG